MTENDSTQPTLPRRRLLALGVVAATTGTGLAGCLGGGGGTAESTDTATPEPTDDSGTASLSEPISPTEDDECGVCKMTPAEYPDYNAQLTVEAGDRVHFCSSGCMAAYYVAPGNFESAHEGASFVGVWAHDHATKDLIDATTAWFVKETNADRVDDPMMKNPLPFAVEADAESYVEKYEDLTAEDVVRLDDFDVALAKQYRGRFFE
ncbi:MAG: nitrous oxide reductase accessory protein NosL [Halobacterium sp.]